MSSRRSAAGGFSGENETSDHPDSSRCDSNPAWKPTNSATVLNSNRSSVAPPEIMRVVSAVFRIVIRCSARMNNQVGVLAGACE